jgi:hypothetical protein
MINQSPSINKYINDRYITDSQQDRDHVLKTIQDAVDYVKTKSPEEQEHILPYLNDSPVGYELANKTLQAKPSVTLGQIKPDAEYKSKSDKSFRMFMQDRGFANTRANIKLHSSLSASKKDADEPDMTGLTNLMYQAATNPEKSIEISKGSSITGRDFLKRASDVITSDNPGKQQFLLLDKSTILNPEKRKELVDKLDLDPGLISGKVAGKMSTADADKTFLTNFINAINNKYKAEITPEDVSQYSIPVFLNRQVVSVTQTDKSGKAYADPQTIVLPTFVNPKDGYSSFHAGVSQQAVQKKKFQIEAQGNTYKGLMKDTPKQSPGKVRVSIEGKLYEVPTEALGQMDKDGIKYKKL